MFNQTPKPAIATAPLGAGIGVSSQPKNKTPFILLGGMSLLAAASVGAAFYGFYLQKTKAADVEEKKQKLAQTTLKKDVSLEEMTSLSDRIKGMSSIFSNAPSAYSIFTILEDSAEKGVFFSKLTTDRVEGSKSYNVTVTGVARSLEDLYLERKTLQSSAYAKYLSGASVTYDWDPDTSKVNFTIKFLATVPRFGASNLIVDITKPENSPSVDTPKTDLPIPITQAPQKENASSTVKSGAVSSTSTSKVATTTISFSN